MMLPSKTGVRMNKVDFEVCGRSMRWYEWFAALLLLSLAAGVRAESVYKCTDAAGAVAYQSQPCASSQQARVIEIARAPAQGAAPTYAVRARVRDESSRSVRPAPRAAPREMAFECRAGDGRVFYRIGNCPHSVVADATSAMPKSRGSGARNNGSTVQVAARRIPREDACREIHRAGAIGRNGHEYDEHVSTYEHNLGHDPCR